MMKRDLNYSRFEFGDPPLLNNCTNIEDSLVLRVRAFVTGDLGLWWVRYAEKDNPDSQGMQFQQFFDSFKISTPIPNFLIECADYYGVSHKSIETLYQMSDDYEQFINIFLALANKNGELTEMPVVELPVDFD